MPQKPTVRRARYQRYKAEERCRSCGLPKGAFGTKLHCRRCANKWNDYQRLGALKERPFNLEAT